MGPYQADTYLLECLDLPNLPWKTATYSGAKGNGIYKTYETETTIVYKQPIDDAEAPNEPPEKRGKKSKQTTIEYSYNERVVVVYSSSKASKDQKTREKDIAKITEKLDKVAAGLNRYHLKTCCAVMNKVKEILSGHFAKYKKSLTIDIVGTDGTMSFSWSWKNDVLDKLKTRDGIYTLITNKRDCSAKELLELYKSRNGIESRFRDL